MVATSGAHLLEPDALDALRTRLFPLAANLSLGKALHDACEAASDYVHGALRNAFRPGRGEVAILNHVWQLSGGEIATASLADVPTSRAVLTRTACSTT